MTEIGFIGLGIMGAPMAEHLVAAGHHVTGFDINRRAGERLVGDVSAGAPGIAEAIRGRGCPDHDVA